LLAALARDRASSAPFATASVDARCFDFPRSAAPAAEAAGRVVAGRVVDRDAVASGRSGGRGANSPRRCGAPAGRAGRLRLK
jgi:hypothetical protein